MNTISNIHNNILDKIKKGSIKQKPKWYFALIAILLAFGFVAFFLVFLYFISFTGLVLHEHLVFESFSFGPRTVFTILHTIPSLLVLIVIAMFLLLHLFARHFTFAYLKPVALTFTAGLVLTLLTFALVLDTDRDFRIARFGEGQHVPPIDFLHSIFRDRVPREVVRGVILSISDDSCMIRDIRTGTTTVYFSEDMLGDRDDYTVGEFVGAILEKRGDKLYVIGMHEAGRGRINAGSSTPR